MKRIFTLFVFSFFGITVNTETTDSIYKKIKSNLTYLHDSPIGAIASDGNYTKNSGGGLNCSGFAKWIVDGFYYPLTESDEPHYISIQKLREKHFSERGTSDILVYENSRDPYFGLDWTRNLAVELGKKRGENPSYKQYDVIDSSVSEYVPNCGYPILEIERVLIEQANINDENIFLGSINGFFGKNPRLWQHYHVAVFIPFREHDEIKIAVLERNKETSFDYLIKRYPRTYCHLVAIPTQGDFVLKNP